MDSKTVVAVAQLTRSVVVLALSPQQLSRRQPGDLVTAEILLVIPIETKG